MLEFGACTSLGGVNPAPEPDDRYPPVRVLGPLATRAQATSILTYAQTVGIFEARSPQVDADGRCRVD